MDNIKNAKSITEEQKSRFFHVMGKEFSEGAMYGIKLSMSLLKAHDIEIPDHIIATLESTKEEAQEAFDELEKKEREKFESILNGLDDTPPF